MKPAWRDGSILAAGILWVTTSSHWLGQVNEWVKSRLGELPAYDVYTAVLGGLGILFLLFLRFGMRERRLAVWAWLAVAGGVVVAFSLNLPARWTTPEPQAARESFLWLWPVERVHFCEYGVFALVAWRWVRHLHRGTAGFLAAVVLVAGIGLADEAVQGIVGRTFDWRDVFFDTLAGALGVLVVRAAAAPRPSENVRGLGR